MLFHHVVGVFFSFSYGRKHERNSRKGDFSLLADSGMVVFRLR
jgi:hypothetical protein